MNATTQLESMPPDRNAPIGTSLTICIRTDSSSRARTRSTHSRSVGVRSTAAGMRPVARGCACARSRRRGASRRQLLDAAEHRLRRGHVAELQIRLQRGGIELGREPGQREDRLRFAREDDPLAVVVQVDRLDAEAVAADEQPAPAGIPEREGEHAVQALHEPSPCSA